MKATGYHKVATAHERGIERRARAELELQAERVQPAATRLKRVGRCAVIVSENASVDNFKRGLDATIGADKKGTQRTLWIPADGNIQNADYDGEKKTLQAISELRRASGFVVLAFEDTDLSGASGAGTNRVIKRITGIMDRQDKLQEEDDKRRSKVNAMGIFGNQYAGKHKRDFGVLLVGAGEPSDLTALPSYDKENPSVSMLFMPRLILLDTGELTDFIQEPPDEAQAGQVEGPGPA